MCRTDIIAHMQAIADNPLACTVLALQVEARVRIRDQHPVTRFEGEAAHNMILGAILLINDGLIASDRLWQIINWTSFMPARRSCDCWLMRAGRTCPCG